MNYRVTHTTRYMYDAPVPICHNRAHLTPRDCPYQRMLSSRLSITPKPSGKVEQRTDYFGNTCNYFSIQQMHSTLEVKVVSEVEIQPLLPPQPEQTATWESVRDSTVLTRTGDALDAYQFVFPSPFIRPSAEMAAYAMPSFPPGQPVLVGAIDLMRRIHAEFAYDPAATTIATPLEDVLEQRRGVCQDFAQLQIGCLRAIGLPARYVSGYILPASASTAQPMVGSQASHAWLSVYTGDSGWVDLDPTNNLLPAEEHITLAWGRDYDEVSPIRGVMVGGGGQSLLVDVRVVPLDPRQAPQMSQSQSQSMRP